MTTDDLDTLADIAVDILADTCDAVLTALGDSPAATLRPVIEAVLATAAADRWINKQLDETGIRSMDFRNGIEMDIAPARELLAHWVAAARTMLGDAKNYTETRLEFDVKVAESPELYTLVIQRHGPGVLTPHEARQQAEQARDDVLRIVADTVTEANDSGGIDLNDLVTRLEQAGYPLPDDDDDMTPAGPMSGQANETRNP